MDIFQKNILSDNMNQRHFISCIKISHVLCLFYVFHVCLYSLLAPHYENFHVRNYNS